MSGDFTPSMRSLRSLFIPAFFVGALTPALQAQVGIGQWRDHFPYLKTNAVVEGGGLIYCATRNAVFSYDPNTNELQRLSKVNALNDVDITALGWNADRAALLVGYRNGNLDIIRNGQTFNLSDIKRSSLLADKGINTFMSNGALVYVGCGFGIVVVDLDRQEVKETWFIALNAAPASVNAMTFFQDSIYAAVGPATGTSLTSGLYSAWREDPNLASFTQWHKRPDIPNPSGNFNAVVAFAGKLMVNFRNVAPAPDTIFYWDGAWQRLQLEYNNRLGSLAVSPDGQRLVVAHTYDVRELDPDLNQAFFINQIQGGNFQPSAAIARSAGGVWIASIDRGLGRGAGNADDDFFAPNGPKNSSAQKLASAKGAVYVATGSVAGNWSNTFSRAGVHNFKDNEWRTVDQTNDPLYATGANTYGNGVVDILTVAVDPDDANHAFAGSWDEGVIEFRDRHVVGFYNNSNSSLQIFQPLGSENQVQVAGLAYDSNGNLWVTNSNCDSPISVLKKGGGWKAFTPGSTLAGNTLMSDLLAASNNFKWIIRPRGNGLLVFNDGGTIDDTGDDQYKLLNTYEHQGKLPASDVYSVAEDNDNQIWIGTSKGVAVFYNPNAVFSTSGENFDAQQILIEQDGNVQILLETESVYAIAVDGANRKWIGTLSSGAFLVSADGTQQIEHFSTANSPLPSDNVTSIAIDGTTGEVFFGTDQGIVSYRGEATLGSTESTCATVFPNPVRETWTGPVAITGLVKDSDVRITDIAGNLVYHVKSLGGQAIWPATDMTGKRVSTGVYLILASDVTGTYTCNTKVLVVR